MEKQIWELEVIKESEDRGNFKSVLFDFDGTISLIRQGWQNVMKPYFFDLLKEAPGAKQESYEELMSCIHELVDVNTGKQTIYQCISLAEEIEKRGGNAQDPLIYKDEYQRRLLDRIQYRLDGLKNGELSLEDYVVPGSFELLKSLRERGLTLYLASGTDEKYVLNEASLLDVVKYFNGGIYGAQADYKLFSKAKVVSNIITENNLHGSELLGFGDGFVEIENVKNAGGFTVGVASDEENRCGIDEWKRDRLIKANADVIIPDFSETSKLLGFLFKEG